MHKILNKKQLDEWLNERRKFMIVYHRKCLLIRGKTYKQKKSLEFIESLKE